MSGESVKVVVRCRPLNQREKDLRSDVVVQVENSRNQVSLKNPEEPRDPPKQFTFDGVYGIDSNTESIYTDLGFALVESVCEGYNGTVFAYGQTGCGKSFTMQGIPSQKGIIPRAFEHIFEAVATDTTKKYLIRASYLEIYNENVRDLLGKDYKQTLEIHENPDKGVYIQSLSWHECKRSLDCERLMDKGNKNRATGATLMNADSSRSHSIFTINVEMCEKDQNDGEEHYRLGKLNLVDLAGSERQSKTGAAGDRLKEATKINLSLSALGNVISALVDGKSKHVPYRDSKLTRLLQDSLGGNTKTLMIAAISPAGDNYDETLSTLRYANRAKNIKNKPKINEDPKDAMLRELQDEIKRLKDQLAGKVSVPMPQTNSRLADYRDRDLIEEEKNKLKIEFDQKISELKMQYEEEKNNREALKEQMESLKRQYDAQIVNLESNNQSVNYQTPPRPTKSARGDRNVAGKPPRPPAKQDMSDEMIDSSDANQQRLHELEQAIVGGELSNNEELKKKRIKKKKEAEERKRMLAEALRNGNDDEFMLRVYDSVQEEVQYKTKELEKEKNRVQFLQNEVKDLQREFEREREEYLDTIRKQEKQLKLVVKLSQKIQSFIPNDCNYYNLDRIQTMCVWNEEWQDWQVPEVKREKLSLPSMNSNQPVANSHNEYSYNGDFEDDDDDRHVVNHNSPNAILQARRKSARPVHSATARRLLAVNNDYDDVVYANDPRREPEIDRLRIKLENTQYNGNNYFKNKRQSELLSQTQEMKNSGNNGRNSKYN